MTAARWILMVLSFAWSPLAAAGEVRHGLSAPSPTLGRPVSYNLYLPDGYDGATPLPVLFLLHGLGGTADDWAESGNLAETLDRLMAEDTVPPMLVVMPGLGDGWYVDNPDPGGAGATQTAFLADLVPYIDRTWPTQGRRGGRAVAGLSMGGWGAIRFALLRPDLFVAAGSLSGAFATEKQAASPLWDGLFSGAFGRPVQLDRYRLAAPTSLIGALAAAEPRPALYLTCGDDDELELAEGAVLLHIALRRAGMGSELRITDGGHDWGLWARELDPTLRFVGSAFERR
jgi:enterochelin esterase family protein